MKSFLEQSLKSKSDARQDWRNATMEEKLQALIHMQKIARSMAEAANRPFQGVVWGEPSPSPPPSSPTSDFLI